MQERQSETSTDLNEAPKVLLNSSIRQKRSISATLNTSSSGLATSVSSCLPSVVSPNVGGGILYPYMKQLLYTLHLVYEETKLYRSLFQQLGSLMQILYLLANELNLTLYMAYYESEMPSLIKLKSQRVFSTPFVTTTPTICSINTASSHLGINKTNLTHLITQDPPVLSKFLLELMNPIGNSTIINPFPIIPGVCKRTQRAIKIFAVCALCTNPRFINQTYEDLMSQLLFKINLGVTEIPVNNLPINIFIQNILFYF